MTLSRKHHLNHLELNSAMMKVCCSVVRLVVVMKALALVYVVRSALDYISCPLYITMIASVKTAITQIVDLIDTDCADTIS